jgi:hypothetical protein
VNHLPDSTRIWIDGHGPSTLGQIRAEESPGLAGEEDATVRMNVLRCLYDPKGKPWRTGRIRVGTKEFPLSVCTSDRSLPLYTSSGMFADVDVNCRSNRTLVALLSRTSERP